MAKNRKIRPIDSDYIVDEAFNFACGTIGVRGSAADGVPFGWIVRRLLDDGMVGYVAEGNLKGWWRVTGVTLYDRYRRPLQVRAATQSTTPVVVSMDTTVEKDTPTNIHIIRANPSRRPLVLTARRYADLIARCDVALGANVLAAMRTQIIGVPEKSKFSAEELLWDAQAGFPSVLADNFLSAISTVDVSVPLQAPVLQTLRQSLYSELLKRFGGITPGAYKAERVQTAEVSAYVGESIDDVYTLLDTANADAEGIDVEFYYNGYGARYDAPGEEESNGAEV